MTSALAASPAAAVISVRPCQAPSEAALPVGAAAETAGLPALPTRRLARAIAVAHPIAMGRTRPVPAERHGGSAVGTTAEQSATRRSTARYVRQLARRTGRRRATRVVGGPTTQTVDQPPCGVQDRPSTRSAVSAGDKGTSAAAHLDTPASAGQRGDAPVDELHGPVVRVRRGLASVLSAICAVLGALSRPYPREERVPGSPVLVPGGPGDTPLPTAPARVGVLAVAALVIGRPGRRAVAAQPPARREVP